RSARGFVWAGQAIDLVESTSPRTAEALVRLHPLAAACLISLAYPMEHAGAQPLRFEVSVSDRLGMEPLDGRVLLMLSTSEEKEPRFLIGEGVESQQIFGVDADGLRPGGTVAIDRTALGYPVETLGAVPAGDYTVQALLHRYETFR